ncbi:hypothetical protein LVJ94_35275 [Pendulispora rubella]|uniref:Uncharacterized protein n=1 Tax=Pendulispora rubella TaxID=2741070 RepID=A0ABZ2KUC0_9BACT
MIPLIACPHCGLVLRVLGDDAETETLVGPRATEWPDGFRCATCGKQAKGLIEHEASPGALEAARVVEVTPQEAFAALNGLGLPEEQSCTASKVRALLQSSPIRRVAGQDVSCAARFRIEHVELENGTRVYFGAGAEGAVIYRIAPPISYTARVLAEPAQSAEEPLDQEQDQHV